MSQGTFLNNVVAPGIKPERSSQLSEQEAPEPLCCSGLSPDGLLCLYCELYRSICVYVHFFW